MTLRKITIDNSVKCMPQRENKPNMIKNNSLPRKQKQKLQNKKKFIKNVAAEGAGILK